MNKIMGVPLGNSMFMAWEDIDVVLDKWAKGYFGEHASANGSRDERYFEIELHDLDNEDYEKYEALFEKYDAEDECEMDEELGGGYSTLYSEMARRLMADVLGTNLLASIGTAVAIYDGVFFMEKDVSNEKLVDMSSPGQGKSKSLDEKMEEAQAKSVGTALLDGNEMAPELAGGHKENGMEIV